MPRYLIDDRRVGLQDLTLEQAFTLWQKYKGLQVRTFEPKQWARCVIAIRELEDEIIRDATRRKPRWPMKSL